MRYERGDIVLVWFPHSNLQTFKRRPALVVQRNGLGSGLPQAVLALITSNQSRLGHPSRVSVASSSRNGLLMDSVVMMDNLATVLDRAMDRRLGKIEDMKELDRALRHTLGLDHG